MALFDELQDILDMLEDVRSEKKTIRDIPIQRLFDIIYIMYDKTGNGKGFQYQYNRVLSKTLSYDDAVGFCNEIELCILNMQNLIQFESGNTKDNFVFGQYVKLLHQFFVQKNMQWHEKHKSENTKQKEHFTGKGVVYSAVFGDYDEIHEPSYITPGFDYVFFTDNRNIKSEKWKIVYVDIEEGLDPARMARQVKILPWKYLEGYDHAVWVDGKVVVCGDVGKYISKYRGDEPWLLFPHYCRNCAYEEAEACIPFRNDKEEIIREQIEVYRKENFPANYGLCDTAIMVRELNDSRVKKVCEDWWHEIKTRSKRDQLSFTYACWKNDFIFDTCDLYVNFNDFFRMKTHRK